jgi:protein tyrosine/serine phosphatase
MSKRAIGRWLAGLCLVIGAYAGFQYLNGNFHEVIAGEYYRSAQLSPQALEKRISQYGIKSIINLRGGTPGQDYYDDEIAVSQKMGIHYVSFPISARRQLTDERTQELLAAMKAAPKPLLVHCLSGADRTGLASVIYLQQIAGVDEEEAEWQLSPIYGHINLPFLSAFAMDETWERFEHLIGLDS